MRAKCQGTYKNVEFSIMAQAIVRTSNYREIVGYELTIRPTNGGPASEVIELACDPWERVDLDISIIKAFQRTDAILTPWRPLNLWVNLFPATLTSTTAMASICGAIRRCRHKVVIEITENEVVADYQKLLKSVLMLKEAGASVVIDDFGSGAATIKTLIELPVDGIKLDLSVFQHAVADSRYVPLMSGLVQTASNLNIPVVAEGVETQRHLDTAKALGVDYIQGFFVHKPERFVPVLEGGTVRPALERSGIKSPIEAQNMSSGKHAKATRSAAGVRA